MLNRVTLRRCPVLCAALALLPLVASAQPLTTQFTYQGSLLENGTPADGLYDLEFRLFDADVGGAQLGGVNAFDGTNVTGGLFTVVLDFGAQFNNSRLWLEVSVKPHVGGVFVPLSPRQELQGAPYALGIRLPLLAALDSLGNDVRLTNNGTGRVLLAIRGGEAGGLGAIRADSAGDSAIWGQGSTATAEGVTAISTGGADALDAQAQGTSGRAGAFSVTDAANPDPALVALTAGTGPAALLDGRVDIGALGSNIGDLRIYHSASADEQIRARGTSTGGWIDLFDEADNFHSGFEADGNGTGGFAYVYRSASSQGFTVDGNSGGTNEPRVSITGSARSAVFDMAATGNASVLLPNDAISSAECLDEPGVASNREGVASVSITSTTLTTITSRTITVPAAGHVLVMGTTQFQIPHVTGTSSLYNIGVSDSSSALPDNQDLFTTVVAPLPTAIYQKAVSPHGLFSVSAGAHTFFLLGQKTSGASPNAEAFDVQVTLAYFPTAYGAVVSTLNGLNGGGDAPPPASEVERSPSPRAGLTPEEVAVEREQSMLENQARLLRELDEMRTRFDALQKELEQIMHAQHDSAMEARVPKPVRPIVEGE